MRIGRSLAVVICGALLVGCGSSPSFVHSQRAEQAGLVAPGVSDLCSMEYRTLVIGTEAYVAMTGVLPAIEADLTTAGLLLHDVDDFDLVIADGDYQVVAVGDRCVGFEPNYPPAGTDGPVPTDPAADTDPPSASGPSTCEAERKTLEVASEAYTAQYGTPPVTEADLVPAYLRVELDGYDLVAGVIVPVPGVCG